MYVLTSVRLYCKDLVLGPVTYVMLLYYTTNCPINTPTNIPINITANLTVYITSNI